jgi:tetratricopeptide (TPR) repeat protein
MSQCTPRTVLPVSIPVLLVLGLLAFSPAAVLAQGASASHEHYGKVHSPISCSPEAQQLFDKGLGQLHSFFYPETVKTFTAVASVDPTCAMAYWGIAMSERPNPLIVPLPVENLKRGWAAVEKAKAAGPKTDRERDYVAAVEAYYREPEGRAFNARILEYEQAMEQVHRRNPDDVEATIFYALAINEAVDHADKTYARQFKAGALLEEAFARQPEHPGIAHYIIHTYDFPPLAQRGLRAARRYASLAPSAPHALHMPSHTFSMVGLWEELIPADTAAAAFYREYSAKQLQGAVTGGQLHSMDFLTYAYLQRAQDHEAQRLVAERDGIQKFFVRALPLDTAYAAIPVRYAIERGQWAEAARVAPISTNFPAAAAISHFGRALGAARSGDPTAAQADITRLDALHDTLIQAKQTYWAEQVEIQRKAAGAWVAKAEGRADEAILAMRAAADLEDRSEKHIAMENRLIPMRELLADMLLELGQPDAALLEYNASLEAAPNRFRSFYGAAQAAERVGNRVRARIYYEKLLALGVRADTERPELQTAKAFLASP